MRLDKKELGITMAIVFLLCIIEMAGSLERKKYIISESRQSFTQAILKEKELFIRKVKFQYDPQESSTPELSAEKKRIGEINMPWGRLTRIAIGWIVFSNKNWRNDP